MKQTLNLALIPVERVKLDVQVKEQQKKCRCMCVWLVGMSKEESTSKNTERERERLNTYFWGKNCLTFLRASLYYFFRTKFLKSWPSSM